MRTILVGARGRMGAAARGLGAGPFRRSRCRRQKAGFTLVELMVVVVLVAILAMLATPVLRVSRDDRLAFDYARRIQGLIHRGRTRAAGRGAAHLIVAAPSGVRGKVLLFEALDGVAGPVPPGPNPVSSCKTANQWANAVTFTVGTIDNRARIIDGVDLDSTGVNVDADIKADFSLNSTATPAWAMCITPSGTTYVGIGATTAAAITDMEARPAFVGTVEARITRNRGAVTLGLRRRVIATGTAAPRIKSE